MIKKIIIFGLIALAAFIFYKKFMADTLEAFLGKRKGMQILCSKKFQLTRLRNE